MRLGVDARVLVHRPTGVARYLAGILGEAPALRVPGDSLDLFVDRRAAAPLPGSPDRVHILRWPAPGGDPAWRQLRLGLASAPRELDVLFCPFYTIPLALRIPSVVTIHDVAFEAHPEWFPLRARLAFRLVGPSARRASRILAPSRFSAGEIVRLLGVPASRVEVVPLGIEDSWTAPLDDGLRARAREWLGFDGPFVLHLGAVHLRRNVDLAVRAFARAARVVTELRLVIAGPTLAPAPDLARLAVELGIADKVVRREWAPEDLLRGIIAEASAVVYLSVYEGFGLPALEALAVGTPVVALRRASLPEVLGDQADWIESDSEQEAGDVLAAVVRRGPAGDFGGARRRARAGAFPTARAAAETFRVLRAEARGA